MESSQAIIWMIVSCAAFMGLLAFSRQLKIIIKVLIRGVIGLCGIFVANTALSGFGLTVGLNLMTGFIVGVLGVPGFISLYIAQYLL